jgi:hypothetical protein
LITSLGQNYLKSLATKPAITPTTRINTKKQSKLAITCRRAIKKALPPVNALPVSDFRNAKWKQVRLPRLSMIPSEGADVFRKKRVQTTPCDITKARTVDSRADLNRGLKPAIQLVRGMARRAPRGKSNRAANVMYITCLMR